MAVTIKDVAEASGFGIGTVSRVINGKEYVKEETREKILLTAKRLGYRPNKIAKMLASGYFSDSTIGIILPEIAHRFFFEIISGIYSELNEQGYNLLIFNIGKNREQVFEHIARENFSGLLVLGYPMAEREKRILRARFTRFIYLDYMDREENSIFFDNQKGGRLAASYLAEKDCRNICFIGRNIDSQQQAERFEGFCRGLNEKGLKLKDRIDIEIDEEESYRVTEEIIKKRDVHGIFYFCDELAYGGLRAKEKLGKDIRIIGYDDLLISSFMGLSTIRQDARSIGIRGAKKIVELVQSKGSSEEEHPLFECMEPVLVDRGS